MWADDGPDEELRRYQQKFSQIVQEGVESEFRRSLTVPAETQCRYEKWIVCIEIPETVRERWSRDLPGPLFFA